MTNSGTAQGPERDYIEVRTTACHAGSDGDCSWGQCPQTENGEPAKTGRHCPLDAVGVPAWTPSAPHGIGRRTYAVNLIAGTRFSSVSRSNSGTAQGLVTAAELAARDAADDAEYAEMLRASRPNYHDVTWLRGYDVGKNVGVHEARVLAATSTTPDAEVARRAMGEAYDRVDGLLAEFGRVDDAVYLARLRRLYRDLRAALDALPVATSTAQPAGLDADLAAAQPLLRRIFDGATHFTQSSHLTFGRHADFAAGVVGYRATDAEASALFRLIWAESEFDPKAFHDHRDQPELR